MVQNLPGCQIENLRFTPFASLKQVKINDYDDFNPDFHDQHRKLVRIACFKYQILKKIATIISDLSEIDRFSHFEICI